MNDKCWIQQNVSYDLAIRSWKQKVNSTSAQTPQQLRPLNRQSAVDNTAFQNRWRQNVHAATTKHAKSPGLRLTWLRMSWFCTSARTTKGKDSKEKLSEDCEKMRIMHQLLRVRKKEKVHVSQWCVCIMEQSALVLFLLFHNLSAIIL